MATMQEMTETAFGRELVIDRKALKPFAKRTNRAGLIISPAIWGCWS